MLCVQDRVVSCNLVFSGRRSSQHFSVPKSPWRVRQFRDPICRSSAFSESQFGSVQLSQEAASTVTDCLTAAADGQADALLEHVPDGVLDRCIARRKSAR